MVIMMAVHFAERSKNILAAAPLYIENSKKWQELSAIKWNNKDILKERQRDAMLKPNRITIENFDKKIIYVHFKGSHTEFRNNSRKLFNELFTFASENNLIDPDETKVLTIYNDNPFITAEKNLRTSVAMTIPNKYLYFQYYGSSLSTLLFLNLFFSHTDSNSVWSLTISTTCLHLACWLSVRWAQFWKIEPTLSL